MRLIVLLLALLGCEQAREFPDRLLTEPARALCGWVEGIPETVTFPELEPGMCWRIEPEDNWATSELDARPCDVTPGVKYWPGGSTVRAWIRFGTADSEPDEWDATIVECPEVAGGAP